MKGTVLDLQHVTRLCGYIRTTGYHIHLFGQSSFEEDATACTQDSPDAIYEGDEGLQDGTCRPKDAKPPVLEKHFINKECATDNGFGKTEAADREFAYYQRFGWGSANSEMWQTTSTPLPAGEYELKFFSKAFAANNAATSATVTVSDEALKSLDKLTITCTNGSAGIMGTSSWTENSLKFKLEEESAITCRHK